VIKQFPKQGKGTLKIRPDDTVETKYINCELKIYDANNQIIRAMKPTERKLPLEPGIYRAELGGSGADGLALQVLGLIGSDALGKTLQFTVESDKEIMIQIISAAPKSKAIP